MVESTDLLREIRDLLKEIRSWLRLSGLSAVRKIVLENLRDDESRMIYQLSDGNRSTREIVEQLKGFGVTLAHTTVANMWGRWLTLGIVEPSERYQGRYRALVSLESLGIEIPRAMREAERKQ